MVSSRTRSVISGPEIHARGFADDASVFAEIREEIADALAGALRDGVDDSHRLQQVMRRHLGRWVSGKYRRKPMIIPTVVQV